MSENKEIEKRARSSGAHDAVDGFLNALGILAQAGVMAGSAVGAGSLPPVMGAAVFAKAGKALWNGVKSRKAKKQQARAAVLLKLLAEQHADLRKRMDDLEDPEVDLFAATVESAIVDEEEQKLPIYSAILGWLIQAKRPPPIQVRLMSNAVKSLSYLELFAFIEMFKLRSARPIVGPLIEDHVFNSRMEASGLLPPGTRFQQPTTQLGEILFALCKDLELEDIPGRQLNGGGADPRRR